MQFYNNLNKVYKKIILIQLNPVILIIKILIVQILHSRKYIIKLQNKKKKCWNI